MVLRLPSYLPALNHSNIAALFFSVNIAGLLNIYRAAVWWCSGCSDVGRRGTSP